MSLPMWVVYDKPADYPESFVARLFHIVDTGAMMPELRPSQSVVVSPDLDVVREHMQIFGLSRLERSEGDDPKILETWL